MHSLFQSNYSFTAGKVLNFVLYEVMDDETLDNFGDEGFDISSAILTDQRPEDNDNNGDNDSSGGSSPDESESPNDKPDSEETAESTAEGLAAAKKEMKDLHKDHKNDRNKDGKKKEGTRGRPLRIPKGWTVRPRAQTRGPRPKCKGCDNKINYDALVIRHKFRAHEKHKHDTTDQFHGSLECLRKMSPNHLSQFRSMKWTHKEVAKLAKQV